MVVEQQTRLPLASIRIDGGTQLRVGMNEEHISDLTFALLNETRFDPITVFFDGSDYWLADGFHRYHATEQVGHTEIESDVRQGTLRDALLYATTANNAHGLKLTNEDKRKKIKTLLGDPEWCMWSDREIANQCQVDHKTVAACRLLYLGNSPDSARQVQRNGTTYTMNTAAIGAIPQQVEFAPLIDMENGHDEPEALCKPTSQNRYDGSRAAYCKYCYLTHSKWELSDYHAGVVWICGVCDHATQDCFMQIAGVEASKEQQDFYLQRADVLAGQREPEAIINPMPDEREVRREQQRERIAQLREKGVVLPTGTYSCLVVDPPWPMQKIERDVRPNQVEFDYPTMSEDELRAFSLSEMAADDCHLYLWTTQKFLPMALRLAEHWGFRYQCLMTWVKNVGFTPFSWMYSTEHVIFCTKGSLPLMALGKRLDFSAKVREHSRKPDEFYDLVREVSPGPRLDVFSREKRDGFEQYGNEVEKYGQLSQ